MLENAFLSYQTSDKHIAARLKSLLSYIGINGFLAHEDIDVSEEWRTRILEELLKTDLFICLISKNYLQSPYCLQESGIAAFRTEIGIIPLSIDGTIPPGIISNIQSVKIIPESLSLDDLLPAIIKYDFDKGINILIIGIKDATSFREAEYRMSKLFPFIDRMNESQILGVLEESYKNNQVHHAIRCAKEYLPILINKYGYLLSSEKLKFLTDTINQYKE